ncbi:unnamed protein product [Orchesella dallaii]|uniref:Uncharacterized protein n=1 Tax=Orchesella dallaii TaxID=48710 RepID=A0ABP1RJA8_9HEXA
MEEWQKQFIWNNLDKLIETTSVSPLFITKLSCLSSADENTLDVALKSDGKHGLCKLMYSIVMTMQHGFEILAKALYKTRQSGAFSILLRGFALHGIDNVFEKCGITINSDRSFLTTVWKEFKPFVLHLPVNFQGYQLSLGTLLNNLNNDVLKNIIEQYFTSNLLMELLSNRTLPLIKNSIPCQPVSYISRKITSRHNLFPELFDEPSNDVYVIKYIKPYELSALARNQDTDVSSNQAEDLTEKFILLEHEQDFEKICTLSLGKPVHLLEHNEGKLTWLQTYGDISTLQKHVDKEQHTHTYDEEDFVNLCLESEIPVCVSDSPGMGKSVILAYVAELILKQFPERLVQFIILREFVQKLHKKMCNQ